MGIVTRRMLLHGLLHAGALCMASTALATSEKGPAEGLPSLLSAAKRWLIGLDNALVSEFMTDWPDGPALREVLPSQVPVVRRLSVMPALAPVSIAPLVQRIALQANHLEWRRSYQQPAVSAQFMENYGWTEWVGLKGPLPSLHLACGVLLLGPGTHYPWHRHAAEEIYLPLAGRALWRQGDEPWQERLPGAVIYHRSGERHAMRTSKQPMMALYLWRAADLHQGATLDDERESAD